MIGPDGAEIETKPAMALCRCGQSANKPFCDGSHNAAGFKSRGGDDKAEGPDRVFSYEGTQATVHFNPRLCAHAAECGRIAVSVFNPAQKPWVQPDEGTVEQIEAVVAACPSGALQMSAPGGSPQSRTPDRAQVVVQKDGPYWITGVQIETDASAEMVLDDKYVLCRCGQSGNKPYCDGSHRGRGWKSGD